MVVLPIAAALISLIFTGLIAHDAVRRPRPDKLSWVVAFAIFTLAAAAEVIGDLAHWTPLLARVFYLTGAVLVTLFLGLGELYLLAGRRIGRFAPGIALVVVALAVSLVWAAPVDSSRLAADHWRAIDRSGALIAVVAISNAFGVIALAGGSLWSAWQWGRTRQHPHRAIGCLLIALGTLVVAAKGYAEKVGIPVNDEGFYALLTVGSAIIFAGYLETRRRDGPVPREAATDAPDVAVTGMAVAEPPLPDASLDGAAPAAAPAAPMTMGMTMGDAAVRFIEERFLPLADAELGEMAAAWSAPRIAGTTLTREQARRVWALRCRLTPAGQRALDTHSLPATSQLASLYDDVFAPDEAAMPAPPDGRVPATAPATGPGPSEPLTLVGAARPG